MFKDNVGRKKTGVRSIQLLTQISFLGLSLSRTAQLKHKHSVCQDFSLQSSTLLLINSDDVVFFLNGGRVAGKDEDITQLSTALV